ncbi:hypothetical protein NQ317_006282 [Molorchus minor]|uniref:Uncharacterized protein n=1 Tax=Molorchus minor TaxID=1323400 RepID=A0ABQ9J406_9CUCU|nr:hypothetical protein NQ317_006282 [Molorchus minor]
MILFSIVTMRDLIKNYRMIIKGKTQESDTETQPLSSSASSSSHSFGTMREPTVFKHENYSTESEEESVARLKKVKSPYSIQDYMKKYGICMTAIYSSRQYTLAALNFRLRALLSPNFSKHEVDEFPNREETDLFSKIESNDTLLATVLTIIDN